MADPTAIRTVYPGKFERGRESLQNSRFVWGESIRGPVTVGGEADRKAVGSVNCFGNFKGRERTLRNLRMGRCKEWGLAPPIRPFGGQTWRAWQEERKNITL